MSNARNLAKSATVAGGLAPTGVVLPFAGTAAPSGWLLCAGQSLLRADYANLFTAIGTTYGAADGTHFSLPDLRGRVPGGKDNMGGSAAGRLTNTGLGNPGIDGATLGAVGGTDRHTLTTGQIPSHYHQVSGTTAYSSGVPLLGTDTSAQNAASGNDRYSSTVGSDAPHPNAQPTLVLNYIIKE